MNISQSLSFSAHVVISWENVSVTCHQRKWSVPRESHQISWGAVLQLATTLKLSIAFHCEVFDVRKFKTMVVWSPQTPRGGHYPRHQHKHKYSHPITCKTRGQKPCKHEQNTSNFLRGCLKVACQQTKGFMNASRIPGKIFVMQNQKRQPSIRLKNIHLKYCPILNILPNNEIELKFISRKLVVTIF